MSATKRTTKPKIDSRLEFAKAINSITQKEDAFIKSVETLKEFTKEQLTQLDIAIDAKKSELELLDKEMQTKLKDKQIEINQQVAEYKYEAALEILKERKEVPILGSDLSDLQKQLKVLSETQKSDFDKVVEEERSKAKAALNAAINNSNLTHKAETAELNATVKQLQKEIESYQRTLDNQKHEIAEQRKLTMQVAQAGKQGAISQTFGK